MKTQLSILALAVAATTSASAFDPARDKSLGSELDHIIAYVNNDNGNVGAFIVKMVSQVRLIQVVQVKLRLLTLAVMTLRLKQAVVTSLS